MTVALTAVRLLLPKHRQAVHAVRVGARVSGGGGGGSGGARRHPAAPVAPVIPAAAGRHVLRLVARQRLGAEHVGAALDEEADELGHALHDEDTVVGQPVGGAGGRRRRRPQQAVPDAHRQVVRCHLVDAAPLAHQVQHREDVTQAADVGRREALHEAAGERARVSRGEGWGRVGERWVGKGDQQMTSHIQHYLTGDTCKILSE